ncbi:Satratoxin biosynthesis SC1 cluster protein [Lachnellula suecica]|uniref:Satratoxin biosynthesis SC1 cluster protein n=1 Tax=Lachnellula suecica TaxID=602035 RepID=A0A8T9C044_9HELO|nr:Satratoxin biosynthesis SC1 cluster protein [Lachnellula suecica]
MDHPAASKQSQATTLASAIVWILAIIAVVLRFVTRKKLTKAGIEADDWWILIGLLFMFLVGGLLMYGERSDPDGGQGIDRDSPTFQYGPHATYLKVSFGAAVIYFSVVTSIKISILLMYRRVFAVDSFRRHSLIVGALVLFWWLVGTVLTIVSCIPINRLWIGPTAGGYCFNFGIYWMSMGAVELIIDTMILALPLRMVMKLQMSPQQKLLITGIFLLGGFVVVTGVVRVVVGYKPGSQNVAFAKAELWSSVHIGIAIVCACLPTLRPFLTHATASMSSIKTRLHGSGTSKIGHSDGSYSNSSSGSKRRSQVEVLAMKPLKNTTDQHSDTVGLTKDSGGFSQSEFESPRSLEGRPVNSF